MVTSFLTKSWRNLKSTLKLIYLSEKPDIAEGIHVSSAHRYESLKITFIASRVISNFVNQPRKLSRFLNSLEWPDRLHEDSFYV